MTAEKPTLVAVRMKGRAEIFEFPTREAAEQFVEDVKRVGSTAFATAVAIDKEDAPHERLPQLPRG